MAFGENNKIIFGGIGAIIAISVVTGAYIISGAGATAGTTIYPEQDVQVVSVIGPIPPFNPGGPVISVTLENVAGISITSLNATLVLPSAEPLASYLFTFSGVDSAHPLLQGDSVKSTLTAIGAGFDSNEAYPLVITGTLASGLAFNFTQQVMIVAPSQHKPVW